MQKTPFFQVYAPRRTLHRLSWVFCLTQECMENSLNNIRHDRILQWRNPRRHSPVLSRNLPKIPSQGSSQPHRREHLPVYKYTRNTPIYIILLLVLTFTGQIMEGIRDSGIVEWWYFFINDYTTFRMTCHQSMKQYQWLPWITLSRS